MPTAVLEDLAVRPRTRTVVPLRQTASARSTTPPAARVAAALPDGREERQRILQDLHDGVGSHLVGLLALLQGETIDRAAAVDAAEQALEELRLAADSLQTEPGDLATALGTLRWRLQPRLDAVGIRLEWNVAEMPPIAAMPANTVAQILRILMEAFANVMKHAKATSVRLSAHASPHDPADVEVELSDDGIGLPAQPLRSGCGLRNMQLRAATIGAEFGIDNASPCDRRGTRIRLRWPARRP